MDRKLGVQFLFAGLAAAALTACGGGGDGGGSGNGGGNGGNGNQPGQLQFVETDLAIPEAAGTVTLTVSRTAGTSGAVNVTLATRDGNATAGQDYTASTTTVSFDNAESGEKIVRLTIANDSNDEPDETFTAVLSDPANGATLGTRTTVTIRIVDDDDPAPAPPGPLTAAVSAQLKKLVFSWLGSTGATSFRLMAAPTGGAFAQVGAELPATATTTRLDIPVHRYNWVLEPNGSVGINRYRIDACNSAGCTPSNVLDVDQVLSVLATGYLKASDTSAGAKLGTSVAASGDGKTIVLGAPASNGNVGSVYVYRYGVTQSGDPVLLPQPLRISAPSSQAMRFGYAVALNDDGTILAVGAPDESHDQRGVGDYPVAPNTDAPGSGAVFIYSRPSSTSPWSPTPVYIKAIDADDGDAFGTSLALSADGTALVAGAPGQDSPTADIEPTNAAADSGAAYVSIFTDNHWTMLTGFLKATDVEVGDNFGTAVAMNGSGSVILVGAPGEDGNGAGIDPVDTGTKIDSGAMYYFTPLEIKAHAPELRLRNPTRRFKAGNSAAGDLYGTAVAINRSSDVAAVGAPQAATGKGAVYVYSANNDPQLPGDLLDIAVLAHSRFSLNGRYGSALAISADGNLIAVGAPGGSNLGTGVDSRGEIANLVDAGAVDVLIRRPNANWSLIALNTLDVQYVKAINTAERDAFGTSVTLSADGDTLVVGAPGEDSNAVGFSTNNNPGDDSAMDAGAAYLY